MAVSYRCLNCQTELEVEQPFPSARAYCPSCKSRMASTQFGIEPGTTIAGFHIERQLGSGGLGEVKQDAHQLIQQLDGLLTESRPDLQQAVSDLRHVLEQVSRYSDVILQNLDSTSRNMNEFSRQIRENPGRLLGGAVPQDVGVRRE